MAQSSKADVSSIMAMLRASTISDSSSEPATSRTAATTGSSSYAASRHSRPAADADCQYCIGFVMSPRMFREVFRLSRPWQPGSFACTAGSDEAESPVTSEALRAYHYRQFMVNSRGDLPLELRKSVQLDCQHRPVLVRFSSHDIQPIDPATTSVTPENAARMTDMAEVLTREGLRINREAATQAPAAPKYAQKARLSVMPEADTVIIQTNLGNFRRQQNKLVVKAFVRPEAYAHVLEKAGRGDEAAVPFGEDSAWLYKARWVTSLPFMFAHRSISRINTNAEAVVLRGDIARHGFRPGPTFTFLRDSQPTAAQIYYSTLFPYFFVSTSLQPKANCSTHADGSGRESVNAAPATAAGALDAPNSISKSAGGTKDVGRDVSEVRVACFDADDLMHVLHAVVRKLADQDSRGADAVSQATRRTHSDDVGLEAELVPVPFAAPERVFEAGVEGEDAGDGAGGPGDGFSEEELQRASQQRVLDCGQYAEIARMLPDFSSWKKQSTDRNTVVSHPNIPTPYDNRHSNSNHRPYRGLACRSWRHDRRGQFTY